jgi:molybdopterin/thiamine biosynthesis adenylyltransferase
MWSGNYRTLTDRNIGILSEEQQEKLKNSSVAIAGLGGIGSPIAEMLCRLGIGSFNILDHGTFEPTNSNRQIYSFSDTINLYKTDVTEAFLNKINPSVKIRKFERIDSLNIDQFIDKMDVVALGIDSVKPCLYISRWARKNKIPLVEGWAVLFGNVRVFTSETPTLEEVYEMGTTNLDINEISTQKEKELLIHSLNMITTQLPGLNKYYPPEVMERMEQKNEGSTICPVVWLTCSLMAIEIMKVILNWGNLALAPGFASYNPFLHKIPE